MINSKYLVFEKALMFLKEETYIFKILNFFENNVHYTLNCFTVQIVRCVPFCSRILKATNLNMQNYLELFIRELKSHATQEN